MDLALALGIGLGLAVATTDGVAVRESAQARLRLVVKRLLRKYGYPPDKQEKATQTVIEQAEVLSRDWVA